MQGRCWHHSFLKEMKDLQRQTDAVELCCIWYQCRVCFSLGFFVEPIFSPRRGGKNERRSLLGFFVRECSWSSLFIPFSLQKQQFFSSSHWAPIQLPPPLISTTKGPEEHLTHPARLRVLCPCMIISANTNEGFFFFVLFCFFILFLTLCFWPPDDNGNHDDDDDDGDGGGGGGGVWLPCPDCTDCCVEVQNTEGGREGKWREMQLGGMFIIYFSEKESSSGLGAERETGENGGGGWEGRRRYSWPHTDTLSHSLRATHTHTHACVLASTQRPCSLDPYSFSPHSLYVIPHS